MLALVSRLALCSLKSLNESEGSGYSGIARAQLGTVSPQSVVKNIRMVQSFVSRHCPGFVLLLQLAFL